MLSGDTSIADKKKTDPVPEHFGTYDEAAEFWQTHDTTDYSEIFHTMEEGSRGVVKKVRRNPPVQRFVGDRDRRRLGKKG